MRAARQTSSREPKVKIRAAGSLEPGSAFSVEGASEPVSGLAAVFLPLSVNRLKSPSAPSKKLVGKRCQRLVLVSRGKA